MELFSVTHEYLCLPTYVFNTLPMCLIPTLYLNRYRRRVKNDILKDKTIKLIKKIILY